MLLWGFLLRISIEEKYSCPIKRNLPNSNHIALGKIQLPPAKLSEEEALERRIEKFLEKVNTSKIAEKNDSFGEEQQKLPSESSYPLFLEKNAPADYPEPLGNYSSLILNFFSPECPENRICLLPREIAFQEPRKTILKIEEAPRTNTNANQNPVEQFDCNEGVLCVKISKTKPKGGQEEEEEKVFREVKYGSKHLTKAHSKNGLHLIVMKRDPFYKIVREDSFDTHFDRREVERLVATLNNYDEGYIVLLTSAGVWSGALNWKSSFALGMFGALNLQEQQERLREDYSYQFAFLGRKGLCSENGAFKLQRVINEKTSLVLELNINNDPRFSFVAPTVKCVSSTAPVPTQDQRIFIYGLNFGETLKDFQSVQVDRVNCENLKLEGPNNFSCVLKAKPTEGHIDILLVNGQKSPSRTCSYFKKYAAPVDDNGNPVQQMDPGKTNVANAGNASAANAAYGVGSATRPMVGAGNLSTTPTMGFDVYRPRSQTFFNEGNQETKGKGEDIMKSYLGQNEGGDLRRKLGKALARRSGYESIQFDYSPSKGPYTGGTEVCFSFNMLVNLIDISFIAIGSAECSDFRAPDEYGQQAGVSSVCCRTRPLALSLLGQSSTSFENIDGTVCVGLAEDSVACSAKPFEFTRQMEKDYAPVNNLRSSLYRKRTFEGIRNVLVEHVKSV